MASANQFLQGGTGVGGSSRTAFPLMYTEESQLQIKTGLTSERSSSDPLYYTTSGVMNTQYLNVNPHVNSTVTTNSSTSTGALEIFNLTDAGTLTHVQLQGMSTGATGVIRITRDGTTINNVSFTVSSSGTRVCLGSGFVPYGTEVISANGTGLLGSTDSGYSFPFVANITPTQAVAIGGGIDFSTSCVVEIILSSGTFSTSSTNAANNSYCSAITGEQIRG